MYTGQVAQITNRETWTSDFYQIVNEDDGSVINILNPGIGFACSVYIKDEHGHQKAIGTIANGKVIVSASDVVNEPGFQWTFSVTDLSNLCAGTYICGVKTTTNGQVSDLIVGSIAVIEGN